MKRLFVFFLAFMFVPAIAFGATIMVTEDMELRPPGWVAGAPYKFKPGSQAELNDRGEVISGILKFDEWARCPAKGFFSRGVPFMSKTAIRPEPSNYIYFKGYTYVTTFDERGLVLSGTLSERTYFYLIPDTDPFVDFKGETLITFDRNGNVVSGTLNKDTLLRPLGWEKFLPANTSFIKFKEATEVVFGENAQVRKGTITDDLRGVGIFYPAGTTLQFTESGLPQRI